MPLTGGLRDRMLFDSVMNGIVEELASLGWFDGTVYDVTPGGRQHHPITVTDEFPNLEGDAEINTLAFSFADAEAEQAELGSKAEVHFTTIFVDFFAESDALGRHLIGDVYAFLKANPVLPVFDYRSVTPMVDFNVSVDEESVEKRKPQQVTNPWQRNWHICSFVVEDDRANLL